MPTCRDDWQLTQLIESLEDIFDAFDVAILDQWGVLHQGTNAYPRALAAVDAVAGSGRAVVVLSNSGRRAKENLKRIVGFGFRPASIQEVMTSGEAAWRDLVKGHLFLRGRRPQALYPICAEKGDAERWAGESDALRIVCDLDAADALLLMGIPDGTNVNAYDNIFREARVRKLGLICSNPDRTSPRSFGLVTSPGALAARYEQDGGAVIWYGKPYSRVFDLVAESFPNVQRDRIVMVGDSIEHDICGAADAGFATVFVRGGIHSGRFGRMESMDAVQAAIERLSHKHGGARPTFSLPFLA